MFSKRVTLLAQLGFRAEEFPLPRRHTLRNILVRIRAEGSLHVMGEWELDANPEFEPLRIS